MGRTSRIRLQACSLCGKEERTGFYYHEGPHRWPWHGIDGWISTQPLCLRCTRLMIWGREDAPLSRAHRRTKEVL